MKNNYKQSKYNCFYQMDDNNYIYNTVTGALAELELPIYTLLKKEKDIHSLDKTIKEQLLQENFLIIDSIDEDEILEMKYLQVQFDKRRLGIVIAPTLECNFACPYCYEERIKGHMSEEVQNKLIDFIESKIINGTKFIDITWYGGEPLLYKNIIEEITKKINKLSIKYDIPYHSYIITNGYLISDNDIDFFHRNKIRGAQITIDGTASIHDSRRVLKNGMPTYSTIIKNIKILSSSNIDTTIRINIDKTNSDKLEEIVSYIKNDGINNVRMALGHVQSYTNVCKSIENTCVGKEKFRKLEFEFAYILEKYGYKNPYSKVDIERKNIYCGAVMDNYYVIDPKGFLYKCWNDVGNEKKTIGNLLSSRSDINMLNNQAKYINWNPFHFSKCKNCLELPLCLGGCPFMAQELKQVECENISENIPNYIKLKSN